MLFDGCAPIGALFLTQDVLGAKLVAPGMQEPMLTAERDGVGRFEEARCGHPELQLGCRREAGKRIDDCRNLQLRSSLAS
jgi:hypothetical protein